MIRVEVATMDLPCPECAVPLGLTDAAGVQLAKCESCGREFLFNSDPLPETIVESPEDERRKSPRVTFEAPVYLQFEARVEAVRYLTENLSEGGIFIRSDDPLPLGQAIDLEVADAGGKVLFAAKASVAWRRTPRPESALEPGMGLEFTALTDRNRRIVRSLCALHGRADRPSGRLWAVERDRGRPDRREIPADALADFNEATYFVDEGLYQEALSILERLAAAYPDNPRLAEWLVSVRERLATPESPT